MGWRRRRRIFGRRFSADGTPQGATFDPTPAGETFLRPEDVAAVGADRFLVIWNDPEIEGRYVATDGMPITEPFTINVETAGTTSRRPGGAARASSCIWAAGLSTAPVN